MRILRMLFGVDQKRRMDETFVRVDHADRMMANAVSNLAKSSSELAKTRKDVVDDQMVGMLHELSNSMGRHD